MFIKQRLSSLVSEKDVNRTDRTNRFYEGIDNPGLVLLHDILMTYCMYDFDLGETLCLSVRNQLTANSSAPWFLTRVNPVCPWFLCPRVNESLCPPGYVQGMSDLLSPILYVMENEVDAFWCFVSFMDQMVGTEKGFQNE